MTSKQEFLEAKVENFRKYITGFKPSQKILDYISQFQEDQLIPIIAATLLPIITSDTTDLAAEDLMKELEIPDEKKEEVQKKICAYMKMFVEVLLSK
jgi:hypothetical protein